MLPIEQLQQLQSKVFTSELGQRFINHPLLSKDIWSLEELGFSEEALALSTCQNIYFRDFNLPWLKFLAKLTILIVLSEKNSIDSVVRKHNGLKLFNEFLVKNGFTVPELITSKVLNDFIHEGKNKENKQTTISYATKLWGEEGWLTLDYLHKRIKRPEPKVKTIPEDILLKFYENLDLFPEPLERLLRLQIALGYRMSEMLLMPRQCLKQEEEKWYLKKWIAKRKKWEFIEVHPKVAEVVRAQQRFLDEQFGDSTEFDYLFCKIYIPSTVSGRGHNRFNSEVKYSPEILTGQPVKRWIKDFRKEANLVDENGKEFELTSHMLRRTMATTMANCDVPDVLIAAILGHGSLDMLPHYRKRSSEKPVKSRYSTTIYVDKNGRTTNFKPRKTKYERLSELLEKPGLTIQLGNCHRPSMLGDCVKRSGCLDCDHFRVTIKDQPYLEADVEKLEKQLAVAIESKQTRNITDYKKLIGLMKNWLKGIEKLENELGE